MSAHCFSTSDRRRLIANDGHCVRSHGITVSNKRRLSLISLGNCAGLLNLGEEFSLHRFRASSAAPPQAQPARMASAKATQMERRWS